VAAPAVAADAGEEADAEAEDDPVGTAWRDRPRGAVGCMMNPFTLPGPQFLAFYAAFAAVVLLLLHFGRRLRESGPLPSIDLKDPYLFACLGDGSAQVIRVATVGLADRGLLKLSGGTAETVLHDGFGAPRIERKILDHFRGGASLSSAVQSRELLDMAGIDYENRLRRFGLLPDAATQRARRRALALALLALVGVGGAKTLYALSIGRSNVEFLVILTVAATAIATRLWNPYRTRLGDDYLASIQSLFGNLRQRAASLRPGGDTRDLLWLTALFGVAMLPATAFPAIAHVWPRPAAGGSSSSCGSGGSGCGGGGGGGCGGCGS
jgi:uncharacterized protein (TIGR04222 family)